MADSILRCTCPEPVLVDNRPHRVTASDCPIHGEPLPAPSGFVRTERPTALCGAQHPRNGDTCTRPEGHDPFIFKGRMYLHSRVEQYGTLFWTDDPGRDWWEPSGDPSVPATPLWSEIPRDLFKQYSPTVHVAIGNSDNGLSQEEWSEYCARVNSRVRIAAKTVHGEFYSLPNAPWQSACWAFEPTSQEHLERLKKALSLVARHHGQDSIAWNESETTFLTTETKDDR